MKDSIFFLFILAACFFFYKTRRGQDGHKTSNSKMMSVKFAFNGSDSDHKILLSCIESIVPDLYVEEIDKDGDEGVIYMAFTDNSLDLVKLGGVLAIVEELKIKKARAAAAVAAMNN